MQGARRRGAQPVHSGLRKCEIPYKIKPPGGPVEASRTLAETNMQFVQNTGKTTLFKWAFREEQTLFPLKNSCC